MAAAANVTPMGIFCTERDESEHESVSKNVPILIIHAYSVKLYCSADEMACLNKLDLATNPAAIFCSYHESLL